MKSRLFTALVLSAALMPTLGWAAPVDTYEVRSPGPADSGDIKIIIENNDHFDLLSIKFDTSGTMSIGDGTPLVIDGSTFVHVLNGVASATFVAISATMWRIDFTGFNTGDSFEFNWDPDIASDSGYGATVGEQHGMTVDLTTANGIVSGVMQLNQDGSVSVVIPSPVPEPMTLALFGLGLAGIGFARARKPRN